MAKYGIIMEYELHCELCCELKVVLCVMEVLHLFIDVNMLMYLGGWGEGFKMMYG